jgi:hypothetical protein
MGGLINAEGGTNGRGNDGVAVAALSTSSGGDGAKSPADWDGMPKFLRA